MHEIEGVVAIPLRMEENEDEKEANSKGYYMSNTARSIGLTTPATENFEDLVEQALDKGPGSW